MGEHCFRRLNPEAYQIAYDRMEQRQGSRSTASYLLANLPKKEAIKRALNDVIPLAEHLDQLQDILGEKVRRKLGIDLWQHLRDGGTLKVVTETARGSFNTNYASVPGYRLVDPSRKQLAPTLTTTVKTFDAIAPVFNITALSDRERERAATLFSRGLRLTRDLFYDLDDLRRLVSIETTATIRNWAMQPNAAASLFIRRDERILQIGQTEATAQNVSLRACIDMAIPILPKLDLTA
jgi:hypothetical protein